VLAEVMSCGEEVASRLPTSDMETTASGLITSSSSLLDIVTASQQLALHLPVVAVYDKPEVIEDGCKSTI